MIKDNFSTRADLYARYRPSYPTELFTLLNNLCKNKQTAWDVGTGNGQVAKELANFFESVYATDISSEQILNAEKADNIHYSIESAEQSKFPANFFDLIIVAQAVHWFDFEKFYSEVLRTGKNKSIICLIGYSRPKISQEIDSILDAFYTNTIGSYWDSERKFIDDEYKTIPFPFDEISITELNMSYSWNLEHLLGYLNTWSAVKHFIKKNNYNPLDTLIEKIQTYEIVQSTFQVQFPIFSRVGIVYK